MNHEYAALRQESLTIAFDLVFGSPEFAAINDECEIEYVEDYLCMGAQAFYLTGGYPFAEVELLGFNNTPQPDEYGYFAADATAIGKAMADSLAQSIQFAREDFAAESLAAA